MKLTSTNSKPIKPFTEEELKNVKKIYGSSRKKSKPEKRNHLEQCERAKESKSNYWYLGRCSGYGGYGL